MALTQFNFRPNICHKIPHIKPLRRITTRFHFHYQFTVPNSINSCFFNSNWAVSSYRSNRSRPRDGGDIEDDVTKPVQFLQEWLSFIQSVLPGGRWWSLCNFRQVESTGATDKRLTVLNSLGRMWALVTDDSWVIFVAFASLIIAAIMEISIPSLLAASIFSAESGETLVFYRNFYRLVLLCITSGICRLKFCLIKSLKRLRGTLYSVLIFQDISFFEKETVGGLTSRLGAECQRLSHVIGSDVHLILRYVIQGMGALINLLILSWPLALSTLLICSVLSTIFLIYVQYLKEAATITQDFAASANEVSHETLSLMKIVHAYGTERQEFGRYQQWLDGLAFISLRESAAYGLWILSFSSLYRLTQIFAIFFGGMSVMTGHATPEQLTKYVLYCEWLMYAAWRVEDNFSSLAQNVGASEMVFQLMDLLPSDQFLSKGLKLQKLMGHIEFINVSFQYPSRVPVLEHVNISIQANEVVAITGLSGSGKSILVNLLLRLYEPIEGQILLDGVYIKELDIRWLRENIGYVAQEPHFFHMDIKSNIMYGCCKDIKREDVERAAKQAFADEFISSLPNGYETVVDDELLSGGQKQRIAIARAILRDPAILIRDEATSTLDAETEYNIKDVLQGFRNDTNAKRTTIVITHRLSTIGAANRIIVMEGDRVIEMGEHSELLSQNGPYARLNRIQTDDIHS